VKIISICNQKGGCAKTTTVSNLSACLGHLGKRVLVIDNDSQGNLTQSLGIKNPKNTIYELLINKSSLEECSIKTEYENLDIVPSNMNFANAELALANVKQKEYLLKNALTKSKLNYDFILIDCSPSLSLTTINALVCSDNIIIPLEPSIFNLEGLAQLVKILKLVISNYNSSLKVGGVLLTRVDNRSNISGDFRKQLTEVFGNKLFETVIHQNIAVVRSQIAHMPVIYYDKISKAAKEYTELAWEVLKNVK
jgi:chromosome partitioning protein